MNYLNVPDQMDPTIAGIFFLVAIILWAIAGFFAWRPVEPSRPWISALVPIGLALFVIPVCYNAFSAS